MKIALLFEVLFSHIVAMLMMYIRMLGALLCLIGAYIALIFFLPNIGQKIDTILGVSWNNDLNEKIRGIIGKVEEIESNFENKLNNPAPNTTKNIEGRIGQ